MKALSNFHVFTYSESDTVNTDIITAKVVWAAPSQEESCMRRKLIPHNVIFPFYLGMISF